MKVIINGDINRYYIQSLCMLYFPGAKFSESESIDVTTPIVKVKVDEDKIGIKAIANITVGEKSITQESFVAYTQRYTNEKTSKIAIGLALFRAGEAFFKCTPSWGILTGIRPAKVAAQYLNDGYTQFEVKDILTNDFLVNPKKASLAIDVAINETRLINELGKDTCSVYISIPFCPSRCSYCSFVSYTTKKLLDLIPEYLVHLCEDIDNIFQTIRELNKKVVTVYIGGGTPTTLNENQLKILLHKIGENINISDLEEYTLEAGRPDTITTEKLKIAKEYGVTRVSINPQTLNDKILENIGRKHTADDFYKAYAMAKSVGIKYINTDLIAGLPNEKFLSFSKSVDAILKLKPENVTFHTFCVKKAADILKDGTEIYSHNCNETCKSVDYSQVKAKNADYFPYYMYRQKNTIGNFENVGFSLEGAEGLYNIFIMEEIHSIFAVGAGAVTKLVLPNKKIERIFSPKYPYEYLDIKHKSDLNENTWNKIKRIYMESKNDQNR